MEIPYYSASLAARTYDVFYAPLSHAMTDFYVQQANQRGGLVLELGAGTGLVSWALAAAGHTVTATDLSTAMLDLARAKSSQHRADTQSRLCFRQADMTKFDLPQKFGCVFIPGRSFMHLLRAADQRAALQHVHQHLDRDGIFAMNQYDPNLEYCLPDAKPALPAAEAIDPTDGSTCRRRLLARSTDPLMQTFTEHLLVERLSPEGELLESEETQWSLRWSYQQEMRYLLELCGFEVLSLSSDYAGAPPAYGSEQVWVCQKV